MLMLISNLNKSNSMLLISIRLIIFQYYSSAINSVVYGQRVLKFHRQGHKQHYCYFYLHEKDNSILQWTSPTKNYHVSRVDLSKVVFLSQRPSLGGFSTQQSCFFCFPWNRKSLKDKDSSTFLSIFTSDKQDVLIAFESTFKRDLFWQGLQYFTVKAREREDLGNPILNFADKLFVVADKDGNQLLSKKEVKQILVSMHVNISDKYFNQYFQQFDLNNNQLIDQEEFQEMVFDLMHKKELVDLFKKYSNHIEDIKQQTNRKNQSDDSSQLTITSRITSLFKIKNRLITIIQKQQSLISLSRLSDFFKIEQYQEIPFEQLKSIVENLENQSGNKKSVSVSGASFFTFVNILFNEHNTIIDPNYLEVSETSMNNPLADYFIFSSHNTYLMANQLYGDSSIHAYRNAFNLGCKSVEIDCWDGTSEPMVTHGHTLTTKIYFRNVIQAVKDYGFIRSPYPVIISLELHCTPPFQKQMSTILRSILGEQLFIIPKDWENYKELPSPTELKYKVLVKGKGTLKMLSQREEYFKQWQEEAEAAQQISQKQEMQLLNQQHKESFQDKKSTLEEQAYYSPYLSANYIAIFDYNFENPQNLGINDQIILDDFQKRRQTKLALKLDLSLFSCYGLIGKKFSFEDPPNSVWQMCSISEKKLNKLVDENNSAILNFNLKQLTRIYPKGSRISSSNYSTLPCFMAGSQMAALNIQTNDDCMMIYKSQFIENGYSGYILKPEEQRKEEKTIQVKFMKKSNLIKGSTRQNTMIGALEQGLQPRLLVSINFISGQQVSQDLNRTVNPYLIISLKGMMIDEELNGDVQSEAVKNNGFNPIFKTSVIFTIYHPQWATLLVKVCSKSNSNTIKLAQAAVPIRLMRNGYRVLKLEDDAGKQLTGSFLFVNVKKKDIFS